MNKRTAVQLARASAALGMISVSKQQAALPKVMQLSRQKRAEAATFAARRIYKGLKQRWAHMPWNERPAFRVKLNTITMRASHALVKGAATCPGDLRHSERGLPICPECKQEFRFELDEPFASCGCGGTEWGHQENGDHYRRIELQIRGEA